MNDYDYDIDKFIKNCVDSEIISMDFIKKIAGSNILYNIDYSDLSDSLKTIDCSELDDFFSCINTYISNHSVEARILCNYGLFINSMNWSRSYEDNKYIVEAVGLSKLTVEVVKEVVELDCVEISRDGNLIKTCKSIHEAVLETERELYEFIDDILRHPKAQLILAIDEVNNTYILEEDYIGLSINHGINLDYFNIKGPSRNISSVFLDDTSYKNYPFTINVCTEFRTEPYSYSSTGGVTEYTIYDYNDLITILVSEVIRVVIG